MIIMAKVKSDQLLNAD